MINLISRYVDNPVLMYTLIIALFVGIVGAALFLTPRLAAKWDERKSRPENKSFYDGMLTEDPNAAKKDGETVKEEKE